MLLRRAATLCLEVFPSIPSRQARRKSCPGGPSTELRLLQSLTVAWRPRFLLMHASAAPLVRFLAPAALSSESSPLRRVPCGSCAPGLASPGSFRPQGFSPSRRLAPRLTCPALFRAGALLEFHALQSFSLVRSRDASRRPLPSCHPPPRRVDRLMHRGVCRPLRHGRPNRRRKVWLQGFAPRSESVAVVTGD